METTPFWSTCLSAILAKGMGEVGGDWRQCPAFSKLILFKTICTLFHIFYISTLVYSITSETWILIWSVSKLFNYLSLFPNILTVITLNSRPSVFQRHYLTHPLKTSWLLSTHTDSNTTHTEILNHQARYTSLYRTAPWTNFYLLCTPVCLSKQPKNSISTTHTHSARKTEILPGLLKTVITPQNKVLL